MSDVFFYIFAALTLVSALLVVANRNAVNAAMFMIVTFLGMAALFVLLEAYFLAVIQVLVYAGAVVVLFLFIIMLLDVKGGERHKLRAIPTAAAFIALCLLFFGVFWTWQQGHIPAPPATEPAVGSSLKHFGYSLFTTYLLPMQVTGFLLLVAMMGVIVLSKRLDAPGGADASPNQDSAA